ncbi:MAG: ribosome-binding factor A [Patescibacteria group bacterium]|nr:ribosome-binding factor A [Patescibacteria group bacterium]
MSRFRSEKITNNIKELSSIFIEKEAGNTSLITVTRVKLSADKKLATIFISVMPREKENAAYGFIRRNLGEIRKYLTSRMKTRPIPYLEVKIDEGEKNRQRIDELLKND